MLHSLVGWSKYMFLHSTVCVIRIGEFTPPSLSLLWVLGTPTSDYHRIDHPTPSCRLDLFFAICFQIHRCPWSIFYKGWHVVRRVHFWANWPTRQPFFLPGSIDEEAVRNGKRARKLYNWYYTHVWTSSQQSTYLLCPWHPSSSQTLHPILSFSRSPPSRLPSLLPSLRPSLRPSPLPSPLATLFKPLSPNLLACLLFFFTTSLLFFYIVDFPLLSFAPLFSLPFTIVLFFFHNKRLTSVASICFGNQGLAVRIT